MSLSQGRNDVNSIKRRPVRELRVAENYCALWKDLVARKELPQTPSA